ncbi:MAG: DUF2520 domain-containing protein [Synergistaceae bacterium]|nr:DUF2520 domain-containing protein [Synergistaceae bacterium]
MKNTLNLRIGFIGAGKAAVTLGAYFRDKGLKISGYSSLKLKSAQSAAKITSSFPFKDIANLISSSEIIFISTPDRDIAEVWQNIKKYNLKGKIICHLSGSLSSSIFSEADKLGSHGYSIHPMFPFSNKEGDFEGLENATFTIEGTAGGIDVIKEIFKTTDNKCCFIDKKQKIQYHAANVMVSNLITALISIGVKSLGNLWDSEKEAFEALLPLIQGNIYNIRKKGFIDSLTGPTERNDIETIKEHMTELNGDKRLIYALLTKELIEISKVKHPERDYAELQKLLESFDC